MRFSLSVVVLISVIVWFAAPSPGCAQERAVEEEKSGQNRVAVLIGNAKYEASNLGADFVALKVLTNPCNDIQRISAVLERNGWNRETEIIEVCDASRSKVRDAIDQFKDIYLANPKSFGFIYYSGHGIQIGNETYLFGVDSAINLKKAAELATSHPEGNIFRGGVRLFHDIISQVGDAGSGSIFVIIDACRETPIDQYIKANGNTPAEFMPQNYPEPVMGVKLLFSTAYGKLASDGATSGSPFALVLEEKLKQYGNVDLLVSHVIRSVKEKTRNSSIKQVPDTSGSLNPPPPEACLTKCGD
jgi:hypothetical protein